VSDEKIRTATGILMEIMKDVKRKNPLLFIYGISRIEKDKGYIRKLN
jgi:hypothetical protein